MPMWCRYIFTFVSCNVVMLFTCTLVRSRADSKEGVRCETRPSEINSKILGWAWQQDACLERKTRRRLSLSLQQGHEGYIREVLQEDGCSSMYNSWLRIFVRIIPCALLICPVWYQSWFILLIAVYFSRLKIKHDSHEFLLESGTVANIYHIIVWNGSI